MVYKILCSVYLILSPTMSQNVLSPLIRPISLRFSEAVMLILTFAFPGAHYLASNALSFSCFCINPTILSFRDKLTPYFLYEAYSDYSWDTPFNINVFNFCAAKKIVLK